MKGMNERHELKTHGREPEAWPQKNPNSYQPLAGLCGMYVCMYVCMYACVLAFVCLWVPMAFYGFLGVPMDS